MQFTRDFTQLSKHDASLAGGKGASLGEMLQNNILVPDGYVVTADTFDHFIKETDLIQEIQTILDTVDTRAIHTVENASEKIQALIKHSEIPQDIANEVLEQYNNHNMEYVAVRSSATAEDGVDHAWAGQLSSYLNTTSENLLEMVQNCWASLFTPRAIFYRFEKGLHRTHISVAVVIQKMVNSEKSGIAFSVHPITEDYNQIIIEAGLGLGEAIVSGSVTPDSYVVTKQPQKIIDINVNTQNKALYRSATLDTQHGFNEWKDLPESEANEQVLNEDQIKKLSGIIMNIENHYGFPCDIEWAFENNTFYIVQSRPITTLKPLSDQKQVDTEKVSKIFKKYLDNKGEEDVLVIRGRFSPLFVITWILRNGEIALYYGFKGDKALATGRLDIYQGFAFNTFENYLADTFNLEEFKKKYISYEKTISDLYDLHINSDLAIYLENDLTKALSLVQDVYDNMIVDTLFIEFLEARTVKAVLDKLSKKVDSIDTILEYIASTPFNSFEKRFENAKISLVQSGISEDTINQAKYLYTDYYSTKERNFIEQDLATHINKEIEEAVYKDEEFVSSLNQEELKIYEYVKYVTHLRDYRKDDIAKCQSLLQVFSEELINRAGLTKQDALYVLPTELIQGINWIKENKELIKDRINGFEAFTHGRNLIEVSNNENIDLDDIEKQLASHDDPDSISGEGASKGKARGVVRIILDAQSKDNVFNEGDILVTSMTRPEFVPLMKQAGAIVTNEGGITCHAAIVSRELNKPCVIGTKFATQILKDGDLVEVDADNGIVKILEKNISILDRITELSWKKEWAGNWSFFTGNMLSRGYVNYFNEQLGFGPQQVLLTSKENFTTCYITAKDKDDFGNGLAELFNNDRSLAKKWSQDLRDAADEVMTIFDSIEVEGFNTENFKLFLEQMHHYALTHWIVKSVVNYISSKDLVAHLKDFEEARVYSEPVFDRLEKVIAQSFEKISQEKDITTNALSAMSRSEFEMVLSDDIPANVEDRFNQQGILVTMDNDYFLDKDKVDDLHRFWSQNNEGSIIRGSVGQAGRVTGTVRIINDPHDYKIFNDGDILVSSMTRPEFLPLMKKSGGVVTDGGGILCHAAIVARELDIPCVIGTENATSILTDGQEVEIDANIGVVKIVGKEDLNPDDYSQMFVGRGLGALITHDIDVVPNEIGDINRYQRLFRLQGVRTLINDIYARVYNDYEFFLIIKDGDYCSFITQKGLDRCAREGAEIVATEERFKQYVHSTQELMEVIKKDNTEILSGELNKESVKKFFKNILAILSVYKYTDANFSDGAYQLGQVTKDQDIIKRIEELGLFKNKVRDFLNYFLVTNDSSLNLLLKKIGDTFDVNHLDLQDYLQSDVLRLFDGGVVLSQEQLGKRRKSVLLASKDGKLIYADGSEISGLFDRLLKEENEISNQSKVKGTIASPGQVSGYARVISADYDNFEKLHQLFEEMNEGEILVSETTSPDLMPACKKAKGIITNQGGMVSHAAIISREMNIPCIVGTKNATRVIETGDLVELNADEGVAIIKSQ